MVGSIEAAANDGFKAVEGGATQYRFDAHKIKSELDKHRMQCVLVNTDTLPEHEGRKDRKFHAIYADEQHIFKQTLTRAFDYAFVLNKRMCIHIDTGVLTKDMDMKSARKQLIENLKNAQTLLDKDATSAHPKYKGNEFQLMIEPVNNIKGRGIENYFLWSQFEALSIIDEVNANYCGSYPIYLQFDLYHAQTHHGDITAFLRRHIHCIKHIQASSCPDRAEPCNEAGGDLNFDFVFKLLDVELEYSRSCYVGLEYRPTHKNDTSKGLRFDGDWFRRWNIGIVSHMRNALQIVEECIFELDQCKNQLQ